MSTAENGAVTESAVSGVVGREQQLLLWSGFVALLKLSGPVLFLSLQVSSVATAREVLALKAVGSLSPLPNICLLTNCFVWTCYGYMKADGTIFLPNFVGILASMYCIAAFHRHIPVKPYVPYAMSAAVCGATAFLVHNDDAPTVGLIGCSLSVLFTASPLAVLRTVIREKSTASLPWFTSVVIWFNSVSWLLYGKLVADDFLIWGPNVLGFALASVQVALFGIFGVGEKSDAAAKSKVKKRTAALHEV